MVEREKEAVNLVNHTATLWSTSIQASLSRGRTDCGLAFCREGRARLESSIGQQIFSDHSELRDVDSQSSSGEGQTTDLVLEQLAHVVGLIYEPNQVKVFLSNYSCASPTKLVKRIKIKEEALGTPSKRDLETHPRKRVREKSKQFALLLIVQCWTLSLECSLK